MKNKKEILAYGQQIDIIANMLLAVGDNPYREGLAETPARVIKMWKELYRGYDPAQKPKVTVFNNNKDGVHYDQMIIDTGYFYSQCEHHMVPFFGQYYFAYIPGKKVLGLSKVARMVDYYSAKLQVQERLGKEIIDELERELKPQAIGIILKGRHLCKEMRGVKKINGEMITSDLRGKFKTEPETRAEFMSLVNNK
jgi:GTP cyclohydrolase I